MNVAPEAAAENDSQGEYDGHQSEPPVAAPVERPKREPTLIERVSVMHALASAAQNLTLKSAFLNLEGGERAHDLFVQAIEDELKDLMGGSKETELAVALQDAAKDAIGSLQGIRDVMSGLAQMLKRLQGAQPVQANEPAVRPADAMMQHAGPTSHKPISAAEAKAAMIPGLST